MEKGKLKRVAYQTLKGQSVVLLRTIKTAGGRIFEAGTVMFISDKWKGFGLSLRKGGGYDIRCVPETDFDFCPTQRAADKCPRCHGFCHVSGDGTVVMVCPACNGSGIRRSRKPLGVSP
jgi:hypothetical protein